MIFTELPVSLWAREDADNSGSPALRANALPQDRAVSFRPGDVAAMIASWVRMAGGGQGRRFVRDEAELERWRLSAKLETCPHCGRIGTLNAHGWLRGYSELGSEHVVNRFSDSLSSATWLACVPEIPRHSRTR